MFRYAETNLNQSSAKQCRDGSNQARPSLESRIMTQVHVKTSPSPTSVSSHFRVSWDKSESSLSSVEDGFDLNLIVSAGLEKTGRRCINVTPSWSSWFCCCRLSDSAGDKNCWLFETPSLSGLCCPYWNPSICFTAWMFSSAGSLIRSSWLMPKSDSSKSCCISCMSCSLITHHTSFILFKMIFIILKLKI